ncbi:P-loop containing nucleoside triphosphate hydrolase protein [Hypoxylon cercidicola]|nr:P-loop containing nucleoside triphosphate hydrolase protein [Hypoxylon cercidicola]
MAATNSGANTPTDLDVVVFRIVRPEGNIRRVLNRWVSNEGRLSPRQRSSNYSYEAFRAELENLGVSRSLHLRTDNGRIHDEHSFHIFLTRVQRGIISIRHTTPDLLITLEPVAADTPTRGGGEGAPDDQDIPFDDDVITDTPGPSTRPNNPEIIEVSSGGDSPPQDKGKEKATEPGDDTLFEIPGEDDEDGEDEDDEDTPGEGGDGTTIAKRLGLQDIQIADDTWKTYIDVEFNWSRNKWIEGGRQGEEPRRQEIETSYLDKGITRPELTKENPYQVVYRSSCFPAVARLYSIGVITYNQLLRASVESVSKEVTAALSTPLLDRRDAITNALKKSPFWRFRDELVRTSPKFKYVDQFLDEMMKSKKGRDEGGPSDNSGVQHMIIFSDSQLSAFLITMLLLDRYSETINLIYIHGGIPAAQRADMLAAVAEDCTRRSLHKVIVSSFRFLSEGYNLQRANYAIITEMPRTPTIQRQAFGRVDRTGQTQEPVLIQLYDRNNLVEKIRYIRNINRAEIEGVAQAATDLRDIFDDFLA